MNSKLKKNCFIIFIYINEYLIYKNKLKRKMIILKKEIENKKDTIKFQQKR